jgi:hypothetical protein
MFKIQLYGSTVGRRRRRRLREHSQAIAEKALPSQLPAELRFLLP